MLIKLLPENVTRNWDIIKPAIERGLVPIAEEGLDKMNKILESLLAGVIECWVQTKETEEGTKIHSIATTQVLHDYVSDTKSLLIYSIYNFRPMQDDDWVENYYTLKKYAVGRGCRKIIAYSKEPAIIQLIQRLGGESELTFLTLPV